MNMSDKEFFVKTIADEAPRFDRVIKALPADNLEWRPHERSKSAQEMVDTMAGEALTFPVFLKTGTIDMAAPPEGWPKFASTSDAVTAMNRGLAEGGVVAAGMSDADWASESKMMMGGNEVWKTTKGGMALSLLLDLIHHRGQLSTYIRPMGGKVPSIYGPSADSNE